LTAGADPGFQVRGGAFKKIAPSRGRHEIVGVFRVKNHDFTSNNHIIFNCQGRRENFWGISCEKSRFYANFFFIFSNFRGGARRMPPPPPPPPPLNPPLDWLLACLLACLLAWLIDCLIDWLIDWLAFKTNFSSISAILWRNSLNKHSYFKNIYFKQEI
jgi:hypothetical protein